MAEDIVGKVFSKFSGDKAAQMSDREIVLRQRHKELGENKYARFFRQKTDEADVSLAQFFHSLYGMILPLRSFMKDPEKMARLRQIVMEAFIDPAIVDTIRRLSPQAIEARAASATSSELVDEIRADMGKLTSGFNAVRVSGINRCHNMIMLIYQLVAFDYPGLLRKFDQNFTEGPFSDTPKFAPVKIELVAREIGDFLEVTQSLMPESDWRTLLNLLRLCTKEELISETQFAQVLTGLRDIVSSKILLLLAQYGGKNPVWAEKPRVPDEHVAEAWVEARVRAAQACIDAIKTKERQKKIDALANVIFEGEDPEPLENYTEDMGGRLRKNGFGGFPYAEGLRYLACFLREHFERDFHDLCDLVLIRGQWTNIASSKEMSEALHQIAGLQDAIAKLDDALSSDGSDGARLKAAIVRAEKDATQLRYINSIIASVNDAAQEVLDLAAQHFAVIGKHFRALGDDVQRKHPEILVNWRELSLVSRDHPLASQIAKANAKIGDFVQMMQLCSQ
ncbi:MAG: DUF5312 domain-containing protein [Treponema sp.]|nr:DUF5312 domain-containing protein [Treponema sp.]